MKLKLLGVLSVLIFIGGLFLYNSDTVVSLPANSTVSNPCEEPLTYRFGDIDSRFNITEKELADIMQEVEALWSRALNQDLIDYHKEGKVVIQLIYSEEQQRTQDERSFSRRIEAKGEEIKVKKREYQRFSDQYKEKKKDFKNIVSQYDQLIDSYNERAQKWNGQDLSESQMTKLKEMEQEIKNLKSKVDRMRDNLESLRKQTNAKSKQLNKLARQQNEMIATYNKRFGNSTKFDQGQYVKKGESESIKIFQFGNQSQLKTVLAHEVGHALGLSHVNNPESVMYHMMGKQNIFDLELTDEDIAAIKEECGK